MKLVLKVIEFRKDELLIEIVHKNIKSYAAVLDKNKKRNESAFLDKPLCLLDVGNTGRYGYRRVFRLSIMKIKRIREQNGIITTWFGRTYGICYIDLYVMSLSRIAKTSSVGKLTQ